MKVIFSDESRICICQGDDNFFATVIANVHIEILDNFFISMIENWFGDNEDVCKDDDEFCHKAEGIHFLFGERHVKSITPNSRNLNLIENLCQFLKKYHLSSYLI